LIGGSFGRFRARRSPALTSDRPRPSLTNGCAEPRTNRSVNGSRQRWYLPTMHIDPAYIDPGSGSLIIQAVIATLVAIPIFFRHHIARATHAFRGRGASDEATQQIDGPDHAK
jgi:hypothetical protein